MVQEPPWKVDVRSLSHQQIVSLLEQLKGSKHLEVILSLRRELIVRARERGLSTRQIVMILTSGVPRGSKLDEVAEIWAEMLGLSIGEFKQIANVK